VSNSYSLPPRAASIQRYWPGGPWIQTGSERGCLGVSGGWSWLITLTLFPTRTRHIGGIGEVGEKLNPSIHPQGGRAPTPWQLLVIRSAVRPLSDKTARRSSPKIYRRRSESFPSLCVLLRAFLPEMGSHSRVSPLSDKTTRAFLSEKERWFWNSPLSARFKLVKNFILTIYFIENEATDVLIMEMWLSRFSFFHLSARFCQIAAEWEGWLVYQNMP